MLLVLPPPFFSANSFCHWQMEDLPILHPPSCCECQLITTHSWLSLETCSWLNRSCLLSHHTIEWHMCERLLLTSRCKMVQFVLQSLPVGSDSGQSQERCIFAQLSPLPCCFPCSSSLESISWVGYQETQQKQQGENIQMDFGVSDGLCSLCHFLHLFSIYVSLSAFCLLLYSFPSSQRFFFFLHNWTDLFKNAYMIL